MPFSLGQIRNSEITLPLPGSLERVDISAVSQNVNTVGLYYKHDNTESVRYKVNEVALVAH